jgi:hypothetical protein
MVGCFVVYAAVLALAFITDGSRQRGVPLAAVGRRTARRRRIGRP